MLLCSLTKKIHNKWLQAPSNKGRDLYIEVVDNYILAFLQVMAYYQYVKRWHQGYGFSKVELKLRYIQCHTKQINDFGLLWNAFLGMLGANEFCKYDLHHKKAKMFDL